MIREVVSLVLIAATMGGCVTQQEAPPARADSVAASGNLASAMRGVRSVALHPRGRIARPMPGRSVDDLLRATDSAIARTFRSRGYGVSLAERGDRLVAYAIGVSGELGDAELNQIFGISPGVDSNGAITRGAIVIAILNPRTGTVEWRGSLSTPVDEANLSSTERDRRIGEAVDRLLARLPARGT